MDKKKQTALMLSVCRFYWQSKSSLRLEILASTDQVFSTFIIKHFIHQSLQFSLGVSTAFNSPAGNQLVEEIMDPQNIGVRMMWAPVVAKNKNKKND